MTRTSRWYFWHERPWNRLARIWSRGQQIGFMVRVGKYNLQLHASAIRTRD